MRAAIIWHTDHGDIEIGSAGIKTDDSLLTLIILMLFTDQRALENDVLPDQSGNRRGWPGDSYFPYPIGSRLWLIRREKIVPRVLYDAKDYASEALAPLVSEGFASVVSVEVSVWQQNWMRFEIKITKPDGQSMSYGISQRWEALPDAL